MAYESGKRYIAAKRDNQSWGVWDVQAKNGKGAWATRSKLTEKDAKRQAAQLNG